jgi:hypothetical protein
VVALQIVDNPTRANNEDVSVAEGSQDRTDFGMVMRVETCVGWDGSYRDTGLYVWEHSDENQECVVYKVEGYLDEHWSERIGA